ncbi:TATA-binding protein-associated factor 172 [Acanthopagrus latus]|uniref:TATA-binding protein-associated factor 172 n=1 Tax=Acanthopagrus latus TaxID=8177 RepID=UPI00187C130A|nr:TATA-binding protein-associated factor 172 [Acanthopagrus latus]XP_036979125.1 TATA-binding protein-associated factor 172 [Acanthopagrus latus]XP_036979126.1 TATA-binding protein-associated factor 172 [Acanthopagrus latus]
MAVSRLDRLFILLDTGTTPVTRKAAAQQLGEVVKLHPHELTNLLAKVLTYLRSPNWDTRIAAGQAVEAIVKNIPEWNPSPKPKEESCEDLSPEDSACDRLTFYHFDISRLLKHGASLLGSAGAEFELQDDKTGDMDPKERLARQRKLLQKKLGLDMGAAIGMDTEELFNDEDLDYTCQTSGLRAHGSKATAGSSSRNHVPIQAAELIDSEFRPGMSNRQKNKAKRMAKLVAKQRSRDVDPNEKSNDSFEGEPEEKRRKTTNVVIDQPASEHKVLIDNVPDNSNLSEEIQEWPLESFCEELCNDLFNPSWEVRHGAGTGLREILKSHGAGGGKLVGSTAEQMLRQHQEWIEDLVIRLLCVFALDRFGDFVSDEVVAPVRETCAQTLGVALRHMNETGVSMTVDVLLKLLKEDQWEARHGGLLGIKYALAVRQDLISALLPRVLPAITVGLQDLDDDVRAVAASALIPVVEGLVQLLPNKVPFIVNTLWDALLDLDDLTASTNSIMTLLSSLLTYPQVRQCSMQQSLTVLVPRVWPFLRHTISSVRRAALETLFTLLSKAEESCALWINPILQDMLRHIFQSCILESNEEILELVQKVWMELLSQAPQQYVVAASCPWMGAWLCLMMQASHIPIDTNMLLEVKARSKDKAGTKARLGTNQVKETVQEYIAGAETVTDDPATRDYVVVRARLMAAKLLGALCRCICDPQLNAPSQEIRPAESLGQLLLFHLNSKSALQRIAVSMVLCEWAAVQKDCQVVSSMVQPRLLAILSEQLYYDEIAIPFTRMQNECKQLIALLADSNIDLQDRLNCSVFTIDQANELVTTIFTESTAGLNNKSKQWQALDSKRQQAQSTVMETSAEWQQLHLRVHMFTACAVINLQVLPDKLNPLVRPLMEAIKREENTLIQGYAASFIAKLLQQCAGRSPCPNPKIIKNLCASSCVDSAATPSSACPVPPTQENAKGQGLEKEGMHHMVNKTRGIITLYRHQRAAFAITSKRGPAPKAPKTPSTELPPGSTIGTDNDESKKPFLIQRRGAEFSLTTVARHFGADLTKSLPYLWENTVGPLRAVVTENQCIDRQAQLERGDGAAQELVNSLQVLEVMAGAMAAELKPLLLEHLPYLFTCLQHPYTAVRHMAARCVGVLSKIAMLETMNSFLESVLPWLAAIEDCTKQEGAIEALACVMEQLDVEIVPYIVLLVVPVLGRMSDPSDSIRFMATQCFATLIRLLPLEAGIPDPPDMSADLIRQKARERHFLEQLLDGRKLENYKIPVPIKAELRKYQQDGVNWLSFLNKYKLHGILCDDMGLGKTLQSICILAGDHYLRAQEYAKTKAADCSPMPSLVVCPPTLTGHWVDEVGKFCTKEYLNPLHYTGPPTERMRLQHQVKRHNLIVASYDVVRNDIDFFRNIKFNYCILDEGHVIKNGKTKLSKAIKQLAANFRVILSGTPIQNNVLELWSLFDFLMPGFLGTERQFAARYGKPILASRDAKSSSREQEAGVLAMEALHRQVLPFLLRRMKEDVLQDLPPKIIQDYYCNLCPLQVQLYEDFAKSRAKASVEDSISVASTEEEEKPKLKATGHVFQALQYLRKLCNHPSLVLTPQHPEYKRITEQLAAQNSSLRDIQHAPKLSALKQLLLDCGLGGGGGSEGGTEAVVAQHRVLIFCQLKSMLDIVEHDLLKPKLPSVTYLRLDGSVQAGLRHSIVSRFNNDPSIDVLLLTTHVGGLGLNLTGADTVVFVEHDWNPMRDLQAMDRAHRIGQKRVVNVYRLITRGTLEEKIMGLQKFKMSIANTVISQDNASMQSMGTDQLLNLFTLDKGERGEKGEQSPSTSGKASMKSVLDGLGELWDQQQYDTEYNLDNFMHSLQ